MPDPSLPVPIEELRRLPRRKEMNALQTTAEERAQWRASYDHKQAWMQRCYCLLDDIDTLIAERDALKAERDSLMEAVRKAIEALKQAKSRVSEGGMPDYPLASQIDEALALLSPEEKK